MKQTRLIELPVHQKRVTDIPRLQPESDRTRRSAVEAETLAYLGALAKRDPEGFVYPSVARIALKIKRTPYYTRQRILHLEKIGRLIPTQRVRHNREVKGWLVVRFLEWAASQPGQAETIAPQSPSTANDLTGTPNNLAKCENNLAGKSSRIPANSVRLLADASGVPSPSSCLRSLGEASDGLSPSQSTRTATPTPMSQPVPNSSKTKRKTSDQRLLDKINRTTGTLGDELEELRHTKDGRAMADDMVRIATEISRFIAYPLNLGEATLTHGFWEALQATWEQFEEPLRNGSMNPSAFCSKVIDRSLREFDRTWPRSFNEHRNKLREAEKSGRISYFIKKTDEGLERNLRVDPESL